MDYLETAVNSLLEGDLYVISSFPRGITLNAIERICSKEGELTDSILLAIAFLKMKNIPLSRNVEAKVRLLNT